MRGMDMRGNDDDDNWAVLDRYLSGECMPGEATRVARWLDGSASVSALVALVRRVAELPRASAERFEPDAAWLAMRARMSAPRDDVHVRPLLHLDFAASSRGHRTLYLRVAAAVLIAAVLTGAVASWWRSSRPSSAASTERLVLFKDYNTGLGRRAQFRLADGTQVWLDVASRLRLPADYDQHHRDVYLDGEAYFEVARDTARSFRVHTSRAISEDLGTAFLVRAYPEDSSVLVVVTEGGVTLRPKAALATRGVAVTRGQLGRLDSSGLVSVRDDVDPRDYLAWRDGRLVFRATPLTDVARALYRWYGIDVTIADPAVAQVPFTGTFANESVNEALDIVARSLDVHYTRVGRHVRLFAPAGHP